MSKKPTKIGWHDTCTAVLLKYADDLSRRFRLQDRVPDIFRCLERLVGTFAPRTILDPNLFLPAMQTFPFSLLAAALEALPADAAFQLLHKADLPELAGRVKMLVYLLDDKTPFYSLDELAAELGQFREFLQQHRDFLVQTGLPPMTFKGSRWLYEELGRVYDTRCTGSPWPIDEFADEAIALKMDPCEWIRWKKRTGTTLGQAGGDVRGLTVEEHKDLPSPEIDSRKQDASGEFSDQQRKLFLADLFTEGKDPVKCSYAKADFLNGMRAEDAIRLEACRATVHALKLETLDQLVQATRDRRADEIWQNFVPVLKKSIPHDELEFLLSMDRFYLGADVRVKRVVTENPEMIPGGLSNLINVVGHVEKEICIGTLNKTKHLWDTSLPKDAVAQHPGEYPAAAHYFKAYRRPTHRQLDAILDEARRLGEQEASFWQDFAERVRKALGPECRIPVTAYVKLEDALTIAPRLQEIADKLSQAGGEAQPDGAQNPFDPRDKVIYDMCCNRVKYTKIIRQIAGQFPGQRITTVNGIRAAADRYADRNKLPHPPLRTRGRPKKK
ncbi:MAG TPA: hypothetical protein VMJ32_02250 [Pirellulales bacterium]|nr:hypothetical protein [Pirellulales bacterium]